MGVARRITWCAGEAYSTGNIYPHTDADFNRMGQGTGCR
jgi:hypothetical protein